MTTLTAVRYNRTPYDCFRRLRESDKVLKLALVACLRKLPTVFNAMARHNATWRMTSPQSG